MVYVVLPYSAATHISSPSTARHYTFQNNLVTFSTMDAAMDNGTLGLCLDYEFVDGFMQVKEKAEENKLNFCHLLFHW